MRLLLIEDDPMIGESIEQGLREEHYAVDWVRDGGSAQMAIAGVAYDLILLDLGLPNMSGLDVLRWYRAQEGAARVLIITARDSTAQRVEGLDSGADDYLVKPFDLDELFARIRALLRRSAGRVTPNIAHRGVVLNLASHEAFLHQVPLPLSVREFSLLEVLLDPPGQVISKARLEEKLYGWHEEVESNTVDVYIHHLRKKLGAEFIRNVRGVGYLVDIAP